VELTPLAGLHPAANSKANVPTIASLQSELANLKRMVNNLINSEQELWQENIMLQGWFEVLLALKDKMMVTMPGLEAEMRGLWNGMDLEKMKGEVEMLGKQLAQADGCHGHLDVRRCHQGLLVCMYLHQGLPDIYSQSAIPRNPKSYL